MNFIPQSMVKVSIIQERPFYAFHCIFSFFFNETIKFLLKLLEIKEIVLVISRQKPHAHKIK